MTVVKPIPPIPVFADFTFVHQTALNALCANETNLYNYTLGGFRTTKPLVAVRSTTQTIPSGADTQLIWDTADLNYDGMWSASNTGQLTVQTPGVFRIYLQAAHNGTLGSAMVSYICINAPYSPTNAVGVMAPGSGTTATCIATVSLSAGSAIYGLMYQNTGSSQTVKTTLGGCRMHAEWISPQ